MSLNEEPHSSKTPEELATRERHSSRASSVASSNNAHPLNLRAPVNPTTWSSLPRRDQLFILFLTRLADFLQVASLQAYLFYQLKAFDNTASDAKISSQAGILQACFTGTQVVTAILWGKAADAPWCGRKPVLIIGLVGTAISCVGYGFSTTFFWAVVWRAVGGAINGTVGIVRTMIAEITKEKKFQSRAFLILPMSFNVAGILGPIFGGLLAEPIWTLPGLFGEGALFGFHWLHEYPYALPSLMNALALTATSVVVFLYLEETSHEAKSKHDYGLQLGRRLRQVVCRIRKGGDAYTPVRDRDYDLDDDGHEGAGENECQSIEKLTDRMMGNSNGRKGLRETRRLPLRRIWTRNVIYTLVTGAFYDFHLGAFANLWSLFLSTPRYPKSPPNQVQQRDLPLLFTGGLGMPAPTVGFATSFLGGLGMLLQIFLYPPVHGRLGTIRSFRCFLPLFPVAYFLAPYLSILPCQTPAPAPASGILVWTGVVVVLLLQVTARTFTLPASIILLNNCSPHPSVLGTVHGLGQSVSAGFRTVGPVVGGWWYGYGLDIGMVAWGWWAIAITSLFACGSSLGMYEGTGHEVVLESELEEDGQRDN